MLDRLHAWACGREDAASAAIAASLKIACPCCSIWRGVLLGVVLAGLGGIVLDGSVSAAAAGGAAIVGVFTLDWIVGFWRSLPASTGD